MRNVSVASSAWVGAWRERFNEGGASSSARERFPGASSRSTHAAETRPSASKTTPSLSKSARLRWTAGAAAPHSPLKPPKRRSDAMTRCQGTRVSAGQFLRITAPTDRAQPPATAATAPYVVTLPRGMPRTTACTLDSNAVGIPLKCCAATTQCFTALKECSTAAARSPCLGLRDGGCRCTATHCTLRRNGFE